MLKTSKQIIVLIVFVLGLVWGITAVSAGSVVDYGQITGIPARANYVVWWGSSNPPAQVLTEDGFNSATGVDQGYQGGIWRVNRTNFAPEPGNGAQMHILFGGLGSSAGSIWTYNYIQDIDSPLTDHGTVGAASTATCPSMQPGSWDTANNSKVINWSAPAGTYLIYKSVNESGGDNDNSNGRYNYVATVTTSTTAGTYTDTNVTVESWHIVIPAAANGAINGCHSEESNPTAISLQHFNAEAGLPTIPWLFSLGSIMLAVVSLGWLSQKRHKKR